MVFFFFFKQKTAYEMRIRDWSSDVCSSDLSVRRQASTRLPRSSASTSTWACSCRTSATKCSCASPTKHRCRRRKTDLQPAGAGSLPPLGGGCSRPCCPDDDRHQRPLRAGLGLAGCPSLWWAVLASQLRPADQRSVSLPTDLKTHKT